MSNCEQTDVCLLTIAQCGTLIWQTAGRCSCAKIQPEDGNLVVEDDIEEGAVHMDTTIVVQEAQLPELIHEETHP